MGLTNGTLNYLVGIKDILKLSQETRILDIGLSELHCNGDKAALLAFIHAFQPDAVIGEHDISDFLEHCFLYDVCKRFEIQYTCYEVCGERAFTFFDFNQNSVPPEENGAYDLILNFGTSEHIINQYNFFKATHELCSEGGNMLHILPFSGYLHHGFFNYQPKFFFRMAEQNDYSVTDFYVAEETATNGLDSIILNSTSQPDIQGIAARYTCSQASIHIALRKHGSAPFKAPIDHVFIGVVEELKTGITIAPDNAQTRALLRDFPKLAAKTLCIWDTKTLSAESNTQEGAVIPVRPVPESLAGLQAACSTLIITDNNSPVLSSFCKADIIPCIEGGVMRSILSGRVACMPASGEVDVMLKTQPELRSYLSCLYDNLPPKMDTTFAGLPVKKLPEPLRILEEVDIIVVASEAYKISIMRQLEPFKRQGGKVLTKQSFIRITQDLCG